MTFRKLVIAFRSEEQARLIDMLVRALRDDLHRHQQRLKVLVDAADSDHADLLHLLQSTHDLAEQADHLLLAIAGNEAAWHLQRQAEDIFDDLRSLEGWVDDVLTRRKRN
jgi:hypothetical protein